MNSLGLFLWSVIGHWASLMTGGIVIALIVVYEHWKKLSLRWDLFMGIALCFFTYSSYQAWDDEHANRLAAERAGEAASAVKGRQAVKALLHGYYSEGGTFFDRNLPRAISDDDFRVYDYEVNAWLRRASQGIEESMGPAAKVRFLDTSGQMTFTYPKAVNEAHNRILNGLSQPRHNLTILIETNAWDKALD